MAELTHFLTSETARRALARRDIAEVFRILRAAGVSQVNIARATGQQQSEVSEIISGRQVQSVVVLERIADGLGVPRGSMGLAYDPGAAAVPVTPEDPKTDDETNANLLRHAATVLLGEPVFGPARPIPVGDSPTPVPRRIGLTDVKQVATCTQRLGQLSGDLGGLPIISALTAHVATSEALLSAAMQGSVRQRLLVALADAHRAAGAAAWDAGLRHVAREHFIRGMDCAGVAGDLVRAVFALDCLGRLEFDVGQPNEALKLFQLGAAAAPSALARSKLEYDCAWALGLLGARADALAAQRRADDSYEAAIDEPRPWDHFAVALPHVEGLMYVALGHYDRAALALSAAVKGAGHARLCTVSNSFRLAAAQLRCGELRAGLATAGQVIRLARGLRGVSVRNGLAPLQEAAAARRDSACQDLARELAVLRSAA